MSSDDQRRTHVAHGRELRIARGERRDGHDGRRHRNVGGRAPRADVLHRVHAGGTEDYVRLRRALLDPSRPAARCR
jgi:hypothetical protein